MLKSCLPYLASPPDCIDDDNDESKSRALEGAGNSPSLDCASRSKHIVVRVVHAGGKIDRYPSAVLAGKLLENLPGKCLARPEVFKHPHESIICPEECLLPGHKYYVIPLSTVHKLKRKHNKMGLGMGRQVQEANSDVSAATYQSEDYYSIFSTDEPSFGSARDFYVNKCVDGSSGVSRSLQPVSKPKPKPKACSGYSWEPGLTSIQEVSP